MIKQALYYIKRTLFLGFARIVRVDEDRKDPLYPQTWATVCTLPKRIRVIPQFICWILGGHELSNTERGYPSGPFMDKWCRWCNRHFMIPLDDASERDWDLVGMFRKMKEDLENDCGYSH